MKKSIYPQLALILTGFLLLGLLACQPKSSAPEAATEGASGEAAQPGGEQARTGGTARSAAAPRQSALAPKPAPIEIPADTVLQVRLDQGLDTSRDNSGEKFTATLETPVEIGGKAVLPKGTKFNGHVLTAQSSGRLRGRGYLTVTLDSFELDGVTHDIETTTHSWATDSHKKRNTALIGGGSAVGAIIGGIAGGGKGALIGAGAGAAAGTAGAAATGQKSVRVGAETPVGFKLKAPVIVKM